MNSLSKMRSNVTIVKLPNIINAYEIKIQHPNVIVYFTFCFQGCKKELNAIDQHVTSNKNIPPKGFFIEDRIVPGVATNRINFRPVPDSFPASSPDLNNGDIPIILGQQLVNPYSVTLMQQAINILYSGNYPISATHLYVKFLPSDLEQFLLLEETEDLELQDFPMDYEILQDGDYYQDPSFGTEDLGWIYTVVPIGYNFPLSIQKQILDSLYLPENNEILEDLAESMAAGAQYQSYQNNLNNIIIDRMDEEVNSFEFEPGPCYCDPTSPCIPDPNCENGGGGGPGGFDPKYPRGTIQVEDIRTCNLILNPPVNVPVRQARIVCKRWFKIERVYTNDQGSFLSTKKFKNKTKVLLKTKNDHARISKIRGIRLWQILFPVKKRIGVFDEGAMANISFLFSRPLSANAHDRELPYWVAVTTHNAVLEYRQYATEFGISLPPSKLKVLITNWELMRAAGSAPMWNKCTSVSNNLTSLVAFTAFFIASPAIVSIVGGTGALANTLKDQADIIIGYNALGADYNCRLTSANVKSVAFHELGHASHYVRAGCDYWQQYRTRITNELLFGNENTRPYGNGSENNAGVVALGEMWGNHVQYLFSERRYGNGGANGAFPNGFTARMQQNDWPNEFGLNANLNALENFNPNIGTGLDPFQWIPQGICYDLMDARNDFIFIPSRTNDDVSGYTTQNCFNALDPDVRSVPAFRVRLLNQNNGNQQLQVNSLFQDYGY